MSLVLNTNLNSLIAQNSLVTSGNQLTTALTQLSTGLQINSAADNAAGYAISQGMTSQINGLNQAINNANDGVSLAQTASGAMTQITNDLQSMRSLAVQSLNATNSSTDRADLNAQFQQLMNDINSVASQTQFNGVSLLNGTFNGQTFQVGANAGQSITVGAIGNQSASSIGTYYTGTAATAATNVVTTASGSSQTSVGAGTAGSYAASAAALTTDLGTAVTGSSVTLKVTVDGGSAITTGPIALTGKKATDLASIAAGINQALSSTGGIVATVGTNGITLSGTAASGDGHVVNVALGNVYSATGTKVTATPGTSTVKDLGVTNNTVIGTFKTAAAATSTTTSSSASYVNGLSVTTVDTSNLSLISIDNALQQIATSAASLGAYQNRFQAAVTGLQTDATNLSSARSQIVDTNYAQATSQLSKAQILQQASTAMVAQANTIPQNILTLLQKLP